MEVARRTRAHAGPTSVHRPGVSRGALLADAGLPAPRCGQACRSGEKVASRHQHGVSNDPLCAAAHWFGPPQSGQSGAGIGVAGGVRSGMAETRVVRTAAVSHITRLRWLRQSVACSHRPSATLVAS
jgi:hypothetical protein